MLWYHMSMISYTISYAKSYMISWNRNYDIIVFVLWYQYVMISWVYDIIDNIIGKIIYDIMELKLWYHSFCSMISVCYDIICLWYHSEYHMQNRIWYHEIETMISWKWINDISMLWYHSTMISAMISQTILTMILSMIS